MRILLADEGEMARFALAALLEQQPGWVVVGEVVSGEGLLPEIEDTNPDLVLLSWNLPDLQMEEMIPTLCTSFPEMAVIVLSGRPEIRPQAITAGANAFVCKCDPPDRLMEAINSIRSFSQE